MDVQRGHWVADDHARFRSADVPYGGEETRQADCREIKADADSETPAGAIWRLEAMGVPRAILRVRHD